MPKAETPAARAPRGSKPVSQAFFSALETIPEASRAAVAKAAQAMIRDELKLRREKLKAMAAKEKARKPAASKRGGDGVAPKKPKAAATKPSVKTVRRKQASVRAAA